MTAAAAPAQPPALRRCLAAWHRLECAAGGLCFAGVALLLAADVLGRELLAPALRAMGLPVGAGGIFGAQKIAIYLLMVGTYAGVGIAAATGAHLVPRPGFGWVPACWGPAMDRLADSVSGIVLLAAAGFGLVFVHGAYQADVRMPSLGGSLWPVQLAVPAGLASAALRYLLYAAWPALRPPPQEMLG